LILSTTELGLVQDKLPLTAIVWEWPKTNDNKKSERAKKDFIKNCFYVYAAIILSNPNFYQELG